LLTFDNKANSFAGTRGGCLRARAFCAPLGTKEEMSQKKADLLQGTLDLLILKTLALEPMHGWAITQRIQQVSRDVLRVQQGSLYPALHRMEDQGWITAEWGVSDEGRRAKFYRLTRKGRRRLEVEAESWERLTTAIARVLQTA